MNIDHLVMPRLRRSARNRFLLLLCCSWLAVVGQTAWGQASTDAKNFFVLLTTGKSTAGVERTEIERMQAEHLANFGKLFEQEKLFAAGPLGDPERKLRGIVGLKAADKEQMTDYFQADPYITAEYLKVEAYPVAQMMGEFRREFSLTEMEEFQFVIVRSVPDSPAESPAAAQATHEQLTQLHTPEKLRCALRFEDNPEKVIGVMIFKKQAEGELEKAVGQIEMIKAGHWKASIMPLYMSQGILD